MKLLNGRCVALNSPSIRNHTARLLVESDKPTLLRHPGHVTTTPESQLDLNGIIRLFGAFPESERSNLIAVGGVATELTVGPTQCRPQFADLDLGLDIHANPFTALEKGDFAGQNLLANSCRVKGFPFGNRVSKIAKQIHPKAVPSHQASAFVTTLPVWLPGGFSIDFLDRSVLPPKAFTDLSELRNLRPSDGSTATTQTVQFRVQLPLVIAFAKATEDRWPALKEPSDEEFAKAMQDALDIAFVLERTRTPELRRQLGLNYQADLQEGGNRSKTTDRLSLCRQAVTALRDAADATPGLITQHVEKRGGDLEMFRMPNVDRVLRIIDDLDEYAAHKLFGSETPAEQPFI